MQVLLTSSALKQYYSLPDNFKARIRKKLVYLEENPLEGKKLSGKLSEVRSIRVWPYRILYFIDKRRKKIFVITIAHRQGVYSSE